MQVAVTLITFLTFFIEALFHYNIGKNGDLIHKRFQLPDMNETIYILVVLMFFSVINGYMIIRYIQ